MARNKDSRFNAADGFDFIGEEPVQTAPVKSIPGRNVKKEIGSTQGRKGMKLKRMTMAMSDDNHEYVFSEAKRLGISATAFVNQVLDLYREDHPIE
ncbi:MAG: hypothetical protein U0K57_10505 [Lachnospiraceae bacterium]|nr:hypothetical protein [Lachnospiraceae bacterium]